MSLWLFCTIVVVLFLGAIGLLYWGLWGDRSKGRLRCPKCWYDMSGSFEAGKLVCPECGKDAGVDNRLRKNRRRWSPVAVAMLLVAPYGYGGGIWYGWWCEEKVALDIYHLNVPVSRAPIVPKIVLRFLPESLHPFFERFRGVAMSRSKLTDQDLALFDGLNHLEGFYLKHCSNINGEGLKYLSGASKLKWLDLSYTQVGDEGLSHLKDMTQLRELFLSDTQVTDAGLVKLRGLTETKNVYLYDTKVTKVGIAELRRALPGCKVHWWPKDQLPIRR